jgi:hypothetical protein
MTAPENIAMHHTGVNPKIFALSLLRSKAKLGDFV